MVQLFVTPGSQSVGEGCKGPLSQRCARTVISLIQLVGENVVNLVTFLLLIQVPKDRKGNREGCVPEPR